jgi:hypothetical protein
MREALRELHQKQHGRRKTAREKLRRLQNNEEKHTEQKPLLP